MGRTGAHGGQAFFAYSTNYLIDVDNGIIVDVEATTAIRQAEVLAAKRMIERAMERFDLYPARLLGDWPMNRCPSLCVKVQIMQAKGILSWDA